MSEVALYNPEIEATIINSRYVVDGIFNTHGTRQNAERSVTEIQANSIVFLEGHRIEDYEPRAPSAPIERLQRLGLLRLISDKQSEYYQQERTELLDFLETSLGQPGLEDDYDLTLYKELISKDCAILFADVDLSVHDPEEAAEMSAVFMRGFKTFGLIDPILESQTSPGWSYRQAIENYTGYIKRQWFREDVSSRQAAEWMLLFATKYAHVLPEDLRRAEDGRLQAYTLWGTSHAYSLHAAYQELGILVQPKIVEEEPGVEYIPDERDGLDAIAPQRVLADALRATIELGNGYSRGAPALQLSSELNVDLAESPIVPFVQAFQLYKRMAPIHGEDDQAADAAYADLPLNVHNLCSLLGELGLNASRYLEDPFLLIQ